MGLKKISLYAGVLGALASVGALLIPQAVSSQSSGSNSPVISGNGNSVSYQNGFPSAEEIRAQRPNITDGQFEAIKPGMTYSEVLEVVKIPGKEAAVNGPVQIYTWGNEIYVYMTVTLVNGRVQSKSH
ncbi:hypothetical protein [Pseudomonas sp. SLFW]|uniref:hypothetical protein n=1 Tax=Pseudomonas sp. SLFW TaxID=2683259 RepID=UPI001411C1AA|nr:hypothetical protein [Pseudomonas sp. SLFW]NBB12539.1 hypothetical protein [Pseudomonas sp. SLFW]